MTSPARQLRPPPAETRILTVRLELEGAVPPIWRELELRGDLPLDQVHTVLQAAMGWEDYHLHRFFFGSYAYRPTEPLFVTPADLAEGEEGMPEEDVRLDQVLPKRGSRIGYLYDFGDDWTHSLTRVSARPATPDDLPGRCLAGQGACPPEDVGGIYQYSMIVAGLRGDPEHAELAAEYQDWLPQGFDPDAFSPESATAAMAGAATFAAALSSLRASPLGPLHDVTARISGDGLSLLAQLYRQTGDAQAVSAENIATATSPWRVILDAAGTDGIPLTAAGWMRPSVVQQIAAQAGYDRWWIGAANREDQTFPVAMLRSSAQGLRFLRKSKGRLLQAPAGRRVSGDPQAVWDALASALPLGRGQFELEAGALYLLARAAGTPDPIGVCATLLTAAGWRVEGAAHLPDDAVRQGIDATFEVLAVIAHVIRDPFDTSTDPTTERIVRALAARAVRGGT